MRYRLGPWEDTHTIRRRDRYDAVSEEIRATERRDRRSDRARRHAAILLAPLAGLLPAEIQKKMERDFDAPAAAMTIVSALPLFVAGFLGLVGVLMGLAGASLPLPPWLVPPPALAAYLFLESAARLTSAIAAGEPMGTLAAALVLALWRSARREEGRALSGRARSDTPATADVDAGRQERFHVLEPVLALLSPPEQETLAGRFGFDPLRWGRRTALVLLAACAANEIWALREFAQPGGEIGEILWSLPTLLLAVEQVRRWRACAAGRAAGSVLGFLVRPFARPLLN
jgi:hypothetical protein